MAQQTVTGPIVDTLHAAGVRHTYGIVGDSLNGLTEALPIQDDIVGIHTRRKAVLDGRGGEIVDTARTNLLR